MHHLRNQVKKNYDKQFTTGILMGSFNPKWEKCELKVHREVTFHETEERYKIWRGIDMSFQNLHNDFDKILPEHSKSQKVSF